MKISSFLLSTACVTADLFVPRIGSRVMTKNIQGAASYCKSIHGGTLANPEHFSQQQLLDATHGLVVWVGLYRSTAQNKFFPINTVKSFWELLNVSPSSYDWREGEPNNAGQQEYCAVFGRNGKLADANCFLYRPFLCEGSYTRSSGLQAIDAETAAEIKEQQEFQNQQINFNDFLDDAIAEAQKISKQNARRLENLKVSINSTIEFSDREECGESLYAEDKYENEFYYWHLTRDFAEHENVCEIYRDVHDGIIHFIHEFGCSGDVKKIERKFTRLLAHFCPQLEIKQKPFGINF